MLPEPIIASDRCSVSSKFTSVPAYTLERLCRLGGPSLVNAYCQLWNAATEPAWPRGYILPTVEESRHVRTLYEVGLLDRPTPERPEWRIYNDPGHDRALVRLRRWNALSDPAS